MMIYQNTPPAYSLGPKRDSPSPTKDVPGPGHYDSGVQGKPMLAHFPKSEKLPMPKSSVPGPGTYETKARLSPGRVHSLGKKYEPNYDNAVPGPGSYDHSDFTKALSPIRFQGAPKDHSAAKAVPGPGQYDPSPSTDGPRWSLPKGDKPALSGTLTVSPSRGDSPEASTYRGRHLSVAKGSPGPGAYEDVRSMSVSLPGFVTSKSKKEPSYYPKPGVPGPGEYNPVLVGKQEGNYQLGKSTKLPWEKKDTPGPGHYDPQLTDTRLKIALKSRLTDIEMEHKKRLPVGFT